MQWFDHSVVSGVILVVSAEMSCCGWCVLLGQDTDIDSSNVAVSTVSEVVVGGPQTVARSPHLTSLFANNPSYFYPSTIPTSYMIQHVYFNITTTHTNIMFTVLRCGLLPTLSAGNWPFFLKNFIGTLARVS